LSELNLHKKCRVCHEYFPAKPLEFKFFCSKKERCQKRSFYQITRIKRSRHISPTYFDIYDLDRPIKIWDENNKNYYKNQYEQVCRECGRPLLNKNGKYSYHKRYCNEHNGNGLWAKYNWGVVSKDYASEVRDKNKELITQKFNEKLQKEYALYKEIPEWVRETNNLTICEECGQLCQIYSQTFLYSKLHLKTINIHHKIPVHTLDWNNLHLIWDKDNLIALCKDCHNQQDHQLKTKVDPYIKFKKITEFLEVD